MDLSALNSAKGRIHMMNERAVQSLSLFLSNKDKWYLYPSCLQLPSMGKVCVHAPEHAFKGILHLQKRNSVIIYLPSCGSKPVSLGILKNVQSKSNYNELGSFKKDANAP